MDHHRHVRHQLRHAELGTKGILERGRGKLSGESFPLRRICMKNKIKMDLALLMFATVIPNTAFAQDSSNQVPSEQVEFADIYIGDELITVPVVIESEIACKTARSGVQYEDTIESATYYIPVTEEGKAYNEEYVSGARARGTATDTYLDPRKYLTATSIIRYTMSSNDEYVLINNVAITKNRNPESSSTGGYLYGIGTPTPRIVCVGLAKNNRATARNRCECTA